MILLEFSSVVDVFMIFSGSVRIVDDAVEETLDPPMRPSDNGTVPDSARGCNTFQEILQKNYPAARSGGRSPFPLQMLNDSRRGRGYQGKLLEVLADRSAAAAWIAQLG
jgi:hypothetical protein